MYGVSKRINFPMLMRVMGWLMIVEAVFMLVPLVTSLVYGESDYLAFAVSSAITAIIGASMTFFIRPKRKTYGRIESGRGRLFGWID